MPSYHIKNEYIGLDTIKAGFTLALPQPFKTDALNTYDIKPLTFTYDIKPLEIKPLEIKPLTFTYDIKPLEIKPLEIKPLKTDSSIDLKPVVVDLCLTANIGKLPNVCIRQPYRHHVGFTLYGTEVWGFTFSGEQETVIEELDRRPQVALGGAQSSWPPPRSAPQPVIEPPTRTAGGLRIRLGS
jgi:hypothetical protein